MLFQPRQKKAVVKATNENLKKSKADKVQDSNTSKNKFDNPSTEQSNSTKPKKVKK